MHFIAERDFGAKLKFTSKPFSLQRSICSLIEYVKLKKHKFTIWCIQNAIKLKN